MRSRPSSQSMTVTRYRHCFRCGEDQEGALSQYNIAEIAFFFIMFQRLKNVDKIDFSEWFVYC